MDVRKQICVVLKQIEIQHSINKNTFVDNKKTLFPTTNRNITFPRTFFPEQQHGNHISCKKKNGSRFGICDLMDFGDRKLTSTFSRIQNN